MDSMTHEELLESARLKNERFRQIKWHEIPHTFEGMNELMAEALACGLTGSESGACLKEFFLKLETGTTKEKDPR